MKSQHLNVQFTAVTQWYVSAYENQQPQEKWVLILQQIKIYFDSSFKDKKPFEKELLKVLLTTRKWSQNPNTWKILGWVGNHKNKAEKLEYTREHM